MSAITYKRAKASTKHSNFIYGFDFTDALPATVTVSSATATHTPPSGTAITPSTSVVSPYVNVTLGSAFSVTGVHALICKATLSDGQTPVIWLDILVEN